MTSGTLIALGKPILSVLHQCLTTKENLFIYLFIFLHSLVYILVFSSFLEKTQTFLSLQAKIHPPPFFWFHTQIYDSFPPPIRRAPGLKPSILSYNCLFTRLNSYFFVDKEYFTFLTKNKLSFDSKE